MRNLFHPVQWDVPSGLSLAERIRAVITRRFLRETPFVLARVCTSCGALRQADAPWLDACRQVCPCCGATGTRAESVKIRGRLNWSAGKFRVQFYSTRNAPKGLCPALPEGPGVMMQELEDAMRNGG